MLPRFLARGAVDTFYFYDYERQGWVMNEPAKPTTEELDIAQFGRVLHERPQPEPDQGEDVLGLPPGIQAYSMADLSPAQLHNVIAEAVGEPTVPAPKPQTLKRRI